MDDLKTLVECLFDNGSIGTIGERNPSGADSYMCPCCNAYKFIKGYCSMIGPMDAVEHKPDCDLKKLWDMTRG